MRKEREIGWLSKLVQQAFKLPIKGNLRPKAPIFAPISKI